MWLKCSLVTLNHIINSNTCCSEHPWRARNSPFYSASEAARTRALSRVTIAALSLSSPPTVSVPVQLIGFSQQSWWGCLSLARQGSVGCNSDLIENTLSEEDLFMDLLQKPVFWLIIS